MERKYTRHILLISDGCTFVRRITDIEKIEFAIGVNLNKCLKLIKMPISLYTFFQTNPVLVCTTRSNTKLFLSIFISKSYNKVIVFKIISTSSGIL